jgi:hypothetical protein
LFSKNSQVIVIDIGYHVDAKIETEIFPSQETGLNQQNKAKNVYLSQDKTRSS